LNYGHTLAHALETAGRYDLRHGEAVAVGLVFAARLAERMERVDAARVDYHQKVVDGYGLPSTLPAESDLDQLVQLMA
jgi:5-deoxy-5-amino-3-dehydroquinate synthase